MRRREFIAFVGGAGAWPLAVRAQQPDRVRRIGMLIAVAESDPVGQRNAAIFRQSLQELGWTEGRSLNIERRWAGGDVVRSRDYAAELVGLGPDLIVAVGTPSVAALKQATRSIPVVFAVVNDPVAKLIMHAAERHRVPASYSYREYVRDGALMSYGADVEDIVRRTATYVDRILKGANPADLPAQAPTKFELAINLKTAKALRLEVPPTLLALSDEIVE